MATITRTIEIAATPDAVFEALRHVAHLPNYSHLTTAVRDAPTGAVEIGDTFVQVMKLAGVELDTDWVVVEVDSVRHGLRVDGTAPAGGSASVVQRVDASGDGSTVRMTVDYEPPMGILGEIADRMLFERRNEEDCERILDRLRTHCEGAPAA